MTSKHISENVLGNFDGSCWCWHLKRNISMAPTQLLQIFVGLGLVTLLIGTAFYGVGATYILPFSLIEISVLMIAFIYNAIHANDYEKLTLSADAVEIERKMGFTTSHAKLVRSMTRIDPNIRQNRLIQLRQGTQSFSFGQFVHANLRPALSEQISMRLLKHFNE